MKTEATVIIDSYFFILVLTCFGVLTGPRNQDMTPPSVHQTWTNNSQDARMFHAQASCQTSGPYGSPMGIPNPFGTPRRYANFCSGPSGSSPYSHVSNFPRAVNTPSPVFRQRGSPGLNYDQGRACGFNNSPRAGSGYRGSPYSNLGRGNSSPHAGFGNRGTPYPGRGRSGGGRGRGSLNDVSAEERPDRYYNKSMMEDPWKTLEPVVWQEKGNPTSSATDWLPKSITSKKVRVSEAFEKYKSKQSLAEYLAASFSDAVHEPDNEDVQQS